MMDFTDTPRRRRGESIVPMINVVFLLLIFFLMTAQIAPPEPFEVTPPNAEVEAEPESDQTLYIDAAGRIHFDGVEGDAALSKLENRSAEQPKLRARADAALKAKEMARLMNKLAAAGFEHVELIVTAP